MYQSWNLGMNSCLPIFQLQVHPNLGSMVEQPWVWPGFSGVKGPVHCSYKGEVVYAWRRLHFQGLLSACISLFLILKNALPRSDQVISQHSPIKGFKKAPQGSLQLWREDTSDARRLAEHVCCCCYHCRSLLLHSNGTTERKPQERPKSIHENGYKKGRRIIWESAIL